MNKNKNDFSKNSTASGSFLSPKETALMHILSFAFEEKECEKIIPFFSGSLFFPKEKNFIREEYTEKQKTFLNALLDFERYTASESFINKTLSTHKEAGEFLKKHLKAKESENLYMLCLTEQNEIISFEMIEKGDKGTIFANVDDIVSHAVSTKAPKAIIAHNHTSLCMKYSMEDFYATEKLSAYFSAKDITLMEHFVISPFGYHGILYDLADKNNWKT